MPPSNRQSAKDSSAPGRSTLNAPDPLRKIRNSAQMVVDRSDSTLPKKVSTRRLKNALRREKEKQLKDTDMEDAQEVERYLTIVPDTEEETVPLEGEATPDPFLNAFFGTHNETTSFLEYLRGLDPIPFNGSTSHLSTSVSGRHLAQSTPPTPASCQPLPSSYARFATQGHRQGSSMLRRCDTTVMDGVVYRTPDAQAKKRRHEDLEEDVKGSNSNSDQKEDGPVHKKSKYDDADRNARGQTPGPELEPVDTPAPPEDFKRDTTPGPDVQHVENVREDTPEPEARHKAVTPPPTPLVIRPRPKKRTSHGPLRFKVKDWPATVPLPPANIFDDVTPKESGRGWAIVPEAMLWMNNVEGMGFDPVDLTLNKIYEPAKKARYAGHLFIIPGRV